MTYEKRVVAVVANQTGEALFSETATKIEIDDEEQNPEFECPFCNGSGQKELSGATCQFCGGTGSYE